MGRWGSEAEPFEFASNRNWTLPRIAGPGGAPPALAIPNSSINWSSALRGWSSPPLRTKLIISHKITIILLITRIKNHQRTSKRTAIIAQRHTHAPSQSCYYGAVAPLRWPAPPTRPELPVKSRSVIERGRAREGAGRTRGGAEKQERGKGGRAGGGGIYSGLDVGEAGGRVERLESTASVVQEMDVVGGVIVAAQSGKGGGGGEDRRTIGVKRAHASAVSCSRDYGAVVLGRSWGEPWIQSQRRVSPCKEGAPGMERDGYELRSVLSRGLRGHTGGESGGAGDVTRLERSAPASCSVGFADHHGAFAASDTTRALLAPFYRPSNPVFAKPMPARSWVDPLRFLLKKELTVTDVGELGRIILPKRDAECQLPHLDSKEGKLLNMEDYNSNKHWTLRYKWWPNNKSRMYVLESTGEFVKYYDLKEKDELIVYRDGVGNLVIRGQKWSPANSLLRTDSFLGTSGFKGKSTGKRSPKGANTRANARLSPNASSSCNSTLIQAPSTFQAKVDSSPQEVHESADGLDFKLEPTSNSALVNHSSMGMVKMLHPLDCGLLPASILSTSVLTNSVLSTSVLSVEQSDMATIGTLGGSIGTYGAVPGGHSDGVIDWEKLPDPPAIEFGDPPAIEFPGEFECTWGDCI